MQVFDDQPVSVPEELPRFRQDCHGVLQIELISPNSKTFPDNAEEVGLGSSTSVLVALDITRPIRSRAKFKTMQTYPFRLSPYSFNRSSS
jgi:hypothetical protein